MKAFVTRYLNVAGITIGIRFHEAGDNEFIASTFSERLIYNYKSFFIKDVPKHTDFWIDIVWQSRYEVLIQKRGETHYMSYVQKTSENSLRTFYHISFLQLDLVVRTALQAVLPKKQGFLIHASGVKTDEVVYLFMAPSGGGKSTIARLLYEFKPFSDDMVILKKEKEGYKVYQTPFFEKNSDIEKAQEGVLLRSVFFLKKSKENKISKLSDKEKILRRLLPQLFTEKTDRDVQTKTLMNFVNSFDKFFELYFSLTNPQDLLQLVSGSV